MHCVREYSRLRTVSKCEKHYGSDGADKNASPESQNMIRKNMLLILRATIWLPQTAAFHQKQSGMHME
jgi:hypothetical protein